MKRQTLNLIYESLEKNLSEWDLDEDTSTWRGMSVRIYHANRYTMRVTTGSYKFGGFNPLYMLMPWEWWRFTLMRRIERAGVQRLVNDIETWAKEIADQALK